MKGNIAVLAIIGFFIILYLAADFIGGLQKRDVEIINMAETSCNINRFEVDYGKADKSQSLFLDGRDVFISSFEGTWHVPFDAKECRIHDDQELAYKVFQIFNQIIF